MPTEGMRRAMAEAELRDDVFGEDAHIGRGGVVMPGAAFTAISKTAGGRGVPAPVEGARLFRVRAAISVAPADTEATADTVTFCLSKGLGAPVGSVLCGPADV